MPSDKDREPTSIEPVGIEFEVFEADFHSSKWVGVTSIGDDQVVFVSKGYSQYVCVSQYKLRGDRIFILDDGTCDWLWKGMTSSYAVYDLSDGRTTSPMPSGSFKGEKAPAMWLFPPSVMW
uniref:KIB1-4 beta-propeller domain-containing protein n=1 Tax=Arundo donax TaxID=35708 RepID=A0A0A8YVF5_ARUDO